MQHADKHKGKKCDMVLGGGGVRGHSVADAAAAWQSTTDMQFGLLLTCET